MLRSIFCNKMKHYYREYVHTDKWLVLTVMVFAAALVTFGALLTQSTSQVAAASCWRGTTCTGPQQPSFPGSWDANTYSPTSRTISPVKILHADGSYLSDYP